MSWTQITTDFDTEEETQNFGTRHAIESCGKIFDVFTHATISPKCQDLAVTTPPWLTSCSRKNPDRVALVLDSYLHVFSHELQVEISIDLKSKIVSLDWTEHEGFLLCGLSCGRAQLVHVASKKPLPPFDIVVDDEIIGIDGINFTFFTGLGKIFQLNSGSLDLEDLHTALISQDFSKLQKYQQLCQAIEHIGNVGCNSTDFNQNVLTLETSLAMKRGGEIIDILDFDEELIKTLVVNNECLIVLDKLGIAHAICSITMLKLFSWKPEAGKILDIQALQDEKSPNVKLIMVTEENKHEDCFLQICEFPSFQIQYKLKVSPYCRLLDVATDQENPLFVEGSFQDLIENDENTDTSNTEENISRHLQMLRIRGICEGNPEARLVRLVGRQKFEEAEKFAKLNNLPLEEVYSSQATFLINRLASNSGKVEQTDIFQKLEEVLGKITDQDFMVQCCLRAKFDDLKMTRKMLLMARKNLGSDVTDVNKALHRLDTFIFVHGLEHDR